jgi:hypothetical protein
MQITIEQYRAGYARNAVSLRRRFEKIRDSGKNNTGFTLAELQHHADDSLRLSLLSDDALRAHLASVVNACTVAANASC